MPTVTGTLDTILGSVGIQGSVEVALCGYGSRVPPMNGLALAARITDDNVTVGSDGTFTFNVVGNDQIVPAATYYTVTIKDDNGDIVQVNAYRFLTTPPTYDLNLIDPYDPNQPPPPLPPLITNQLQILGASQSMQFNGDVYTAFKTTLTGDVTDPQIDKMIAGNLYTFIIEQDGAGNHLFVWPSGVKNAARVDPDPNSTTVQTFVADEFGNLLAIEPATYYP